MPCPSQNPTLNIERLVIERLCARFDAVLLYGSCARGDDRANSDVDVLVINGSQRLRIELPERFSVSLYTPEHFRAMARRGSLFVLHLREEARVLVDRRAVIPPLLREWVPPDYCRLQEGMRAAAAVLDLAHESVAPTLLRRVALFVLRSVLYAECARLGRPSFAMSAVARVLGESRISILFDGLAAASDRHVLERSRELIAHYLGKPIENPFAGLDALAVGWHRCYPMASHLAVQVLTGEQGMGYASAPADWTRE
jgi:predicted nucleotidyltransferase